MYNSGFCCKINTKKSHENYGKHIGESIFYQYFLTAKTHFTAEFISINGLENIDFITRSFSVKISKEIKHPSRLEITIEKIEYNSISLTISFKLSYEGVKAATSEFEILPVDTVKRKIITKSSLYEKIQFDQLSV